MSDNIRGVPERLQDYTERTKRTFGTAVDALVRYHTTMQSFSAAGPNSFGTGDVSDHSVSLQDTLKVLEDLDARLAAFASALRSLDQVEPLTPNDGQWLTASMLPTSTTPIDPTLSLQRNQTSSLYAYLPPDQARFRQIFDEINTTDRANAHARTLIQAFLDPTISGQSPDERFWSILALTQDKPFTHFKKATIRATGTGVSSTSTGDRGFRRQLQDSIRFLPDASGKDVPMHRSSSDQIGHFLTAADMGYYATLHENEHKPELVSLEKEIATLEAELSTLSGEISMSSSATTPLRSSQTLELESQLASPRLSPIIKESDRIRVRLDELYGMVAKLTWRSTLLRRFMIGHEEISEVTGPIAAALAPLFASDKDIEDFLNGRLDLISVNDLDQGNSYQDLLLTWVGYRFGSHFANGRFKTRDEAARWLEIMLTDTDLTTVTVSDPFYQDALDMQEMLQQFERTQQR